MYFLRGVGENGIEVIEELAYIGIWRFF